MYRSIHVCDIDKTNRRCLAVQSFGAQLRARWTCEVDHADRVDCVAWPPQRVKTPSLQEQMVPPQASTKEHDGSLDGKVCR